MYYHGELHTRAGRKSEENKMPDLYPQAISSTILGGEQAESSPGTPKPYSYTVLYFVFSPKLS